jgi:alpha-beta hydrolase superfamily lysophospholipase
MLDRYFTRLLSWAAHPIAWGKEISLRIAYAVLGGIGFYCMRPGIVPVREAAYRGAVVSLILFLLDACLNEVPRWLGCSNRSNSPPPFAWIASLWPRLVLAGLFALLVPVIAGLHPLHTVPKRTPASFGLGFEDIRFRTADGLELAAWVVPHERARGNVIFCHGHGRNRGHVAGLLETLHDLQLNVLAFDFRGHGDSAGHTSTFGHREVADLLAAEAYVRQRFPGQPLFLVGISLGAAVSLQALPQLPSVQGVWSEGCFSHLSHGIRSEFAWVPVCLRRPLLALYNGVGWVDCGFWARRIKPIDSLRQVRVPIYFVHGQQDELVPFADGQALYATYGGPKWHWWVENASHYDVRQRHREEYLRRFRGFLEDRLADIRIRARCENGPGRCSETPSGDPAPDCDNARAETGDHPPGARGTIMKRTEVTYGQLDKVLRSFGFSCRPTRSDPPGRIYEHQKTGAVVLLPAFSDSDRVFEHHLIAAQTELDNFGIADPSVFAARVQKTG